MKFKIQYTIGLLLYFRKNGSKYCDEVTSMNMHYSIMNGSKCRGKDCKSHTFLIKKKPM